MSEDKAQITFEARFALHVAEVVGPALDDRRIVATVVDPKLNEQARCASPVYKAGADVEVFLRDTLRDITRMINVRALGLYREGLTM
jgi:hypothetical protein